MADMVTVAGAFMDAAADSAGVDAGAAHQTCTCLVKTCANYTSKRMAAVAALRKTTIDAVVDRLSWDEAQRLGLKLWADAPDEIKENTEAMVCEAEEGCYDEGGGRCGSIIGCACGYCDGDHLRDRHERALMDSLTELSRQRRKEKSCSPSSSSSASG